MYFYGFDFTGFGFDGGEVEGVNGLLDGDVDGVHDLYRFEELSFDECSDVFAEDLFG
jgi:hypothetical protein